jgi:hypothetical protein
MSDGMKRISYEELKEMFPNDDHDSMIASSKEQGVEITDVPEKKEEAETAEETTEQQTEETLDDSEEEEVDERTKKGLIAARQKEKEKRRAIEAEKNAEIDKLTKQLEELRNSQSQLQAQTPAPPAPTTQQNSAQDAYYDALMDAAEIEAKKQTGIDKNLTSEELFQLQFTEPRKYQKYTLALNTIASDMHRQNVEYGRIVGENNRFRQEAGSDPMADAIYKFADDMLDDKPRKESRQIEAALDALNNNRADEKQLTLLRTVWAEAKEKFYAANGKGKPAPQLQAVPPQQASSKLDTLATAPRSANIKASGVTSSMSEAELLRMFDEDPIGALDKVPAATLNRFRRG